MGFCGGLTGCWTSCRSGSSSELAKASESGVERRSLNFPSRREGLLDVIDEGLDWLALPPAPVLLLLELMVTI